MSILLASGANNGLSTTVNLSNPVSCTKMVWVRHASSPGTYNPIISTINAGVTAYNEMFGGDGPSVLAVQSAGSRTDLLPTPTYTNWNCYAMTAGAAGAGSLIGYYQDNAGGGFASASATGASFTVSNDSIAARGTVVVTMTMAYYKEWNVVLTPTQLQAEFLAATPVISGASLSRYLVMNNAASAGTDTSGNSFNMTVVGALSDGSGLPTFAPANPPRRLPRRIFSTTYFG